MNTLGHGDIKTFTPSDVQTLIHQGFKTLKQTLFENMGH